MLGGRKQSPTPVAKTSSAVETLIGRQTEFAGDISFSGGLRVDGTINGDITATGGGDASLVVSESGSITGNVKVAHVVINGSVTGNVISSGKVELQPSARVNGDVHYKVIEMALGSAVNGAMVRDTNSSVSQARPIDKPAAGATANKK